MSVKTLKLIKINHSNKMETRSSRSRTSVDKWFAVLIIDMDQKTRPRIEKTQNPKKLLHDINQHEFNNRYTHISKSYKEQQNSLKNKHDSKENCNIKKSFPNSSNLFEKDISSVPIEKKYNSETKVHLSKNDKTNNVNNKNFIGDNYIKDFNSPNENFKSVQSNDNINGDINIISEKNERSNKSKKRKSIDVEKTHKLDVKVESHTQDMCEEEEQDKYNISKKRKTTKKLSVEKKKIIKSFLSFNIDIFSSLVEEEEKKFQKSKNFDKVNQYFKNNSIDTINKKNKNIKHVDLIQNQNFSTFSGKQNSLSTQISNLDYVDNKNKIDIKTKVQCNPFHTLQPSTFYSDSHNNNEVVCEAMIDKNELKNFNTIIDMNKESKLKIGQIHGHFNSRREVENFIELWSEGTRGTISKAARGEMLAKHFGFKSFGDFSVIFFEENVNDYLNIVNSK